MTQKMVTQHPDMSFYFNNHVDLENILLDTSTIIFKIYLLSFPCIHIRTSKMESVYDLCDNFSAADGNSIGPPT